jgi:hypothetical protein
MPLNDQSIQDRLKKLGLEPEADESAGASNLSSAFAALSCFPMYMVSNVHAWTADKQWVVPVFDIPGFEQLREAFAIEQQETTLAISKDHRSVLGTLLWKARPMDLVMYEYALDTLGLCLDECDDNVANKVRATVARTIMAVAKASGERLFGTGEKISPEEQTCIDQIAKTLDLHACERASSILDGNDK